MRVSAMLGYEEKDKAPELAATLQLRTTSEMSQPTFAVVIPLHDKGAHIERALKSVLAQTTQPTEIIVVDDASTDDGLARVRAYPEVHIIERCEPGPGGYAARNAGVQAATAKWVAFLDADDAWSPGHLAECAHLIAAAGAEPVMVGSGYHERHPGGRVARDVYTCYHADASATDFNFDEFVALWLKIGECPVWTSAVAAQREVLISVGGFPAGRCRRGGDKDTWLRLAHAGLTIIGTRATATYFKDADNMLTAQRHANERHCILPTLEAWLPKATKRRRRLIRRLRNRETFAYALRTVKTDRLRYSAWRGFSIRDDPVRFAVLALLTTPLGPTIGRLAAKAYSPAR